MCEFSPWPGSTIRQESRLPSEEDIIRSCYGSTMAVRLHGQVRIALRHGLHCILTLPLLVTNSGALFRPTPFDCELSA